MAEPLLTPQSTKQYLVSLGGVQAYFTKITAPKWMKAETKYNDGQTGTMKTHLDFLDLEKVSLTKNYDAAKDGAIDQALKTRRESGEAFEVTIQPVLADKAGSPVPNGKTIVLQGCRVVSVTYPAVDREGSGLSTMIVEVIPDDIVLQ